MGEESGAFGHCRGLQVSETAQLALDSRPRDLRVLPRTRCQKEKTGSQKAPELHGHAVACTHGKIKYMLEKQICLVGGSNEIRLPEFSVSVCPTHQRCFFSFHRIRPYPLRGPPHL